MTGSRVSVLRQRPPKPLAWAVVALVSTAWAVLRLVVFRTIIFPLTYALPLLVCVWTRDKAMLWTMAGAFAVLHTIKQFSILPGAALPSWADWATYGATLFNVFVGAIVTHAIIVLRERLEESLDQVEAQSEELARQNEELAQQGEELAQQNEELSQQSEELSQQAEELSQQTEELSQQTEELSGQNEELQAQAEEIQALNTELGQREGLLQNLLDVVRLAGTEGSAVEHVCRAAIEMVGPPVNAVALYETDGERLVVRGAAGPTGWSRPTAAADDAFARLVIEQNRAACLNDVALRPDLGPDAGSQAPPARALLGAPLHAEGRAFGAVVVYGAQPHEWTAQQFRIAEWLATEASQILHTLRLRDLLARHAALIDLTPDAAIVRKLDGTILLWGGGAEALYGWTKEEALGQTTHALLRTVFPRPLPEIVEQLERTGQWTGDLVHTTKDGRQRTVESRWLARRNADGTMRELLESNVDITERKRTEEALREADRRKNEFLATLSHELRNPLAPIRYALQLLDTNGNGDRAQPRQVIERQLAHLVRLVDDLLDATRIASNKIRLRRRRVEVSAIVEQAVEACTPEIQQSSHALAVCLPPEPIWLDADPDRMAQVLTNLLTNSCRYMAPGGRIRLSCAKADGQVLMSVSDTGIGLQAEDLSRVFEMFAQVGEPGQGGLGIGLSLVKGLVELHGGRVEARSAGPGRGAEFVITLPHAGAPAAEPHAAAPHGQLRFSFGAVDSCVRARVENQTRSEVRQDGPHASVIGHINFITIASKYLTRVSK